MGGRRRGGSARQRASPDFATQKWVRLPVKAIRVILVIVFSVASSALAELFLGRCGLSPYDDRQAVRGRAAPLGQALAQRLLRALPSVAETLEADIATGLSTRRKAAPAICRTVVRPVRSRSRGMEGAV